MKSPVNHPRFIFCALLLVCSSCVSSSQVVRTNIPEDAVVRKPGQRPPLPTRLASRCRGFHDGLLVSFLNIGQGESILVTCPDRRTQTLIDAGESSERYPGAEELFAEEFAAIMGNDSSLEFAISTHPHQDHIFGFQALLGESGTSPHEIGVFVDNGANDPSTDLAEWIRARVVETGGTYVNAMDEGLDAIQICPFGTEQERRIELTFLSLDEDEQAVLGCPEQLNDCSLVNRLEYEGFSFLFAGDTTTRWEYVVLANPALHAKLSSSVLKVGHHGSASTTKEFLAAVDPEFAVISAGAAGVGTTGLYRFPELAIIDLLNDHFDAKLGADRRTDVQIEGCDWRDERCYWTQRAPAKSLFVTASMGTTTFYVTSRGICVGSDLLADELVVEFETP